ncbi:GNAT family N-acetyltransferase [Tenacibaculum mesophilum]|uniref:GNAT family N-acetyltransferase n=1 Tax=Tenacibaculum mesophilum TaxID=104268 RepID=UPI00249231F0|nr:GNAT family N-acetyltransferase [Tenacibaculum mesophilum]
MTEEEAEKIAILLNERNQLVIEYDKEKVLSTSSNYVFIKENDEVIACAESKKVQWYQSEISHISVSKLHEGKGYGRKILLKAEKKAKDERAKIIQCTIRENNDRSLGLFKSNGYEIVNKFFYQNSGNWVFVLQKNAIHKKGSS